MKYNRALVLVVLLIKSPSAWASCESPVWLDDFHSLRSYSTDVCPSPDETKSLFTRVGTLACSTREGFQLAYNAREHNWHYVQSAGIADPSGARNGTPSPPTFFGCKIYPDGIAIQISRETVSAAETNIGWLSRNDLRNSDVEMESARGKARNLQVQRSRPKLCYPNIIRYRPSIRGKCFYTDVHPNAQVPSGE